MVVDGNCYEVFVIKWKKKECGLYDRNVGDL